MNDERNFSEEINEQEAEEAYNEPIMPEKIHMPDITPSNDKESNKGLKIFCIIMAAVILATGSSLFGYFVGKNSGNFRFFEPGEVDTELESKPDASNLMSVTEVYEDAVSSIVGILVYNEEGEMSQASGVVYTEDGYIVTNDHIYASIPSAKFKVFTSDKKEYNAYFVAGDTRSDLAVLKISENVSLNKATLGNSEEIIAGEAVCAIGCPNGYNTSATVTTGIVSTPKTRKSITSSYSSSLIQTDTAINPGNSGGGLINMYGQIVGVTSSKIAATSYEGVGFAIPSKTVKKVVESLIENGNVKNRARLGISYVFYDSAMAEINGLKTGGLQIAEVDKDSSLFGAVEKNDIITRINDFEITDDGIVLDILDDLKPDDTVLLTIKKTSGKTVNVTAKLLADVGSSSYVSADTDSNKESGEFNFPEGF